MAKLRMTIVVLLVLGLAGCERSTKVADTTTSSSAEPAIGLSGEPLPPRLNKWADVFFRVVGSLSAIGEGAPDEQDDRCRVGLVKLETWRSDMDDAPDKRLDELQEVYVEAVEKFYRACAADGSTDETARPLQKATDAGTKIYERLRELDVPASIG